MKRAAGRQPAMPEKLGPGPLRRGLRILVLFLIAGLFALGTLLAWALQGTPWKEIADGSIGPPVVEAAERQPAAAPSDFVEREEFPQHLVDAVLAVEDRRFYEHFGLDLRGIARAVVSNFRAGAIVQGGSTITQQLIKIVYLRHDRTFKRKIQEAVIALWLEYRLDKDEILTRYLNSIYLGAGATGMEAAARVYFDKDVKDLDLVESALLAGLIRAPSMLNPLENPEGAVARANLVLDLMVADGKLSEAEAEKAKQRIAELRFAPGGRAAVLPAAHSNSARACDVKACARAYRSFRPSDCTYQPYSGPRLLCEK